MKVWKGLEQEGKDKGVMTLFVKRNFLDGNFVLNFLKLNEDCRRLYLGAGRTDVVGFWIDEDQDATIAFKELVDYCKEHRISIVMEVSLFELPNVPEPIFESVDQVIVRVMNESLKFLSKNDFIKIDTGDHVYISEIQDMIHTDLADLKDDVFSTVDLLLYSKKEDKNENNSCTN